MQYAFVLRCCDVMALCTASQISNKVDDYLDDNDDDDDDYKLKI